MASGLRNRRNRSRLQARERNAAIVVVSLCLTLAASVTAYRFLSGTPRRASAVDKRHALAGHPRYRLSALRIFSDVLQRVRDTYVDPSRIRPRQMLLSALEALQQEAPEVIVHAQDDGERVIVQVDAYRRSFDAASVRSLHMLYRRLKEVVGFVERHLDRTTDIRKIEYACINGALSRLDPHSVLWDPQTYREMKVGTRGSFGGLGIVISIRNGVLTVIAPIDDTPAARAGIEAGDRIVRIGSESTVNMTLNEAVNRLRGEPGTKVVIYVERKGQPQPRRYEIVRAVIKWKTVESRVLAGQVGYLRIKHFSRTTSRDLEKHLSRLKKKGVVGLVLDLYNNPGGLLDQAIRVADMFLESGVIVTTVGNAGKQRDEKRAGSFSVLGNIPIVLLVNSGSASASEIVAGALKNQGRAVVVGETTFGKGSVQVLYDNRDGSALKLTIAQYLTPGDVSIQSTGISPDVRMVPVRVRKERVVFFAAGKPRRERDLTAHLDPYKRRRRKRAAEMIRYLEAERKPKPTAAVEDGGGGADPVVVKLARDLILQGYGMRRRRVLRLAKEFLASRRRVQRRRIAEALLAHGIDWSVQPAGDVPMLEAEVETLEPGRECRAGDTLKIKVTVSNLGLGPAYRVRAMTEAESPALRDLEFFFGKIAPGGSRSFTATVRIPKSARSAVWRVRFRFFEEYGHQPPEQELRLRIRGRRRAVFAARYQLIDPAPGGNGDGLAQWGESLRLRLSVRNIGPGTSPDTVATLKNLGGPEVFLHRGKGRLRLGELAPGQQRDGEFRFDLRRTGTARVVKLQLHVYDNELHEGVEQRILLPVSRRSRTVAPVSGWVRVSAPRAPVSAGADERASSLGMAPRGASFRVSGRAGGFYRVEVADGQPGFVPVSKVVREEKPPLRPRPVKLRPEFQLTPPLIRMDRYPLSTAKAQIQVSGTAYDDERIKDVYVEVRHPGGPRPLRKVYYRSNRHGATRRAMRFRTPVPLKVGLNHITVVARETHHVRSQRTLVVLRQSSDRALTALGLKR
jgi:carboxyl-terminal processing protease